MKSAFFDAHGTRLRYVDHGGADCTGPTVVMFHGITSNARAFDAIVRCGLGERYRCVAVDLRGRGLSSTPETGYGMADHARDIVALLDHLGARSAALVGHSFGGLLGFYMAARHADRVSRLVSVDAAMEFHPRVMELLGPSFARLGKTADSLDAYLESIRATPAWHGSFFDDDVVAHYSADVEMLDGGRVRPRSPLSAIQEASRGLGVEPWPEIVQSIAQPVLLLNATEPYGPPGTPPLLPRELAQRTVSLLKNGVYGHVPGNHVTMIFGEGARRIARLVEDFLVE